jgi:uncharacterized membrane protein YqiK
MPAAPRASRACSEARSGKRRSRLIRDLRAAIQLAMIFLPVIAVVVVVGVWWSSRVGELFYISVRDGVALVIQRPTLGQLSGIAWLAWMLDRSNHG